MSMQMKFRRLMGRFVTGITVIALRTDDGEVAAMTANAVTAVSLDPLMLLCCIRNNSGLLSPLLSRGTFSVNILSADQGEISRHYGGQKRDVSPATWLPGGGGVPVLAGANASFICHVHSSCRAGDHTVIFGTVQDMAADEQPSPALVFAAGQYRDLALSVA